MRVSTSLNSLSLPALLMIVCLISPGDGFSQGVEVPISIQCQLFSRVLLFDFKLTARAGDTLVIGIVFQSSNRVSELAKEQCEGNFNEIARKPIQGLPLVIRPIDLSLNEKLDSQVVANQADIILVTPLRAYPIEKVTAISRAYKRLTLSTVTDYVEAGLSIGIDMKNEKPEIVVNLPASRLEGAELSAKLLKLCRVVGTDQ